MMKKIFPGVCEDGDAIIVSDAQLTDTRRKYEDLRREKRRPAEAVSAGTPVKDDAPASKPA
jgi:hypothetical protein